MPVVGMLADMVDGAREDTVSDGDALVLGMLVAATWVVVGMLVAGITTKRTCQSTLR